jgi:hypothetical protein
MSMLGITRQVLAGLLGTNESRLCSGLKGTILLSSSEIEKIEKTLENLSDLAKSIDPLTLPLHDVARMRLLLEKYQDGFLVGIVDRVCADGLRAELARLRR